MVIVVEADAVDDAEGNIGIAKTQGIEPGISAMSTHRGH